MTANLDELLLDGSPYRELLDSLPDGLLVADPAGRVVYANAHAETLFGYTTGTLRGQPIEALLPQRLRAAHLGHRSRYLGKPRSRAMGVGLELLGLRPDGSEFPLEISLSPIGGDGAVVMSAIRDTTGRRTAELQFRGLLESAPDAMVIVDREGRIARVNSQAEKLFGYARSELLGKAIEVLLPERLRGSHPGHRDVFFSRPHPLVPDAGMDLFGRRADGSEFPIEISLAPIETGEGTLVASAIRDISEKKRIERALQEKNAELEAANQELQAFDYSISHDLRAPLNRMRGFNQALAEDYGDRLDETGLGYLGRIAAGVAEMEELVEDLLSLSMVSRGSLQRTQVDVAEVARGVIAALRRLDPVREVEFVVDCPHQAYADEGLVRIALQNLVGNAWKFTGRTANARIELGCAPREGGEVEFWVRDNGAGFDAASADRLFAPFQRLHSRSEFPGTGIGLATVQRIVRRHGGRTRAEGETGKGAVFYFTLAA